MNEEIVLDEKTTEEVDLEWKNYCMSMCRIERDKLLSETDWIHLPDVSVSEQYKEAMNIYRQQLRDFPASFSDEFDNMEEDSKYGVTPQSFSFPVKPEE